MKNLTLVIPAKNEETCLPQVLDEIKHYECSTIVVLEKNDKLTINSIKNFNCKIIFQTRKGYGNAIIEGINEVKTDYLCVFNADGSFNPKYLKFMLEECKKHNFVFASRYLKNSGSEDDTLITKFGNFLFSLIGNMFFSLNLSDILFTFVLGETRSFKKLELERSDFTLCVEIPINAKKRNLSFTDMPNYERKRIGGKKKVNEFIDGFKILIYLIERLFTK
tara:strand:+ start:347 stop:1009 length:663 start_codon:yes stop_codon:yes gene_type:complete